VLIPVVRQTFKNYTAKYYLGKKSTSPDTFLTLFLPTTFKNPFSTPLQRPYSCDFDTENAYRKPPVIL
jgi:hypothetical protein